MEKKTRTYRRDGRPHLTPRADGRYQLRVDGRRIYGRTEDEVYDKADQIRQAAEDEEARRKDPTVKEYGDRWIQVAKAGVTEKVYDDYAKQLTKLYQVAGSKKMREVTALDIKEAFNLYLDKSQSLIKRTRMLWLAMFEAAVEEGLIRRNPVKQSAAQPARGTEGSHRAITEEERELIHKVEHKCRLLALVMLYCGLRRGEALAIDLDKDWDQKQGVLKVTKAIRFTGNRAECVDPKTEAGAREVPVPAMLAREMKGKHGLLLHPEGRPEEYATEQCFGRTWESYNHALCLAANGGRNKRWWGKKKGDDPEKLGAYREISIRPHDLRHSYCTMLRDAGVEMKVSMQWMGHADEKMILRIYDHTEERKKMSAKLLDKYLGGKKKKQGAAV